MPRSLPQRPSIQQLKNQAKDLLQRLRLSNASVTLSHAQHLIALEYGFLNWRALHDHVDEMTGERLQNLGDTFRRFASLECRGSSSSYECWANHIATDAALLSIAAFGRTPIPNLFFAAVHLLVLENPGCNLARHYASIESNPMPAESGWPRFREFCHENRQAIVQLMRARTTQTNEVRRSAYLAAAFSVVYQMGDRKPLALIEIGTSAGINLCFDHFGFRMDGTIFGDSSSSLVLEIESRGKILPPIPKVRLPVRLRIGLDLRPVTADDTEGVGWLNALVWPEHRDRRRELAAALHISTHVPRQLVAGDAAVTLPEVLRGIPDDCTVCVFQTHSFNQIATASREKMIAALRVKAETHSVFLVSRTQKLTLECFSAANPGSELVLAETDSHGRWIEWLAKN
jgi:hypothetical protein